MTELILQTKDLRKTYHPGTVQAVEALRGIHLDFEKGRYYAIIGKSGCGKSTLLHILGALDTPTAGQVICAGEDVFGRSRNALAAFRRRQIGFVFQSYNLLQEHTVLENILMPLHLDGRDADEEYLHPILEMLEIEGLVHKFPSELSGGEQQRVAIARAVSAKPAIVLADEPTGNLDPATGRHTLALMQHTMEQLGQTLILVTHDMDIAEKAHVLIRIHQGEIVDVT